MDSIKPGIKTLQPDSELLELFLQHADLNALGALYRRYMFLVYGVCMKYLKNREDSQDAVMQIFEVIIADIPRFEIRNFKAWLYGVTRNHCLMKLRREKAEKNRHDRMAGELFMESTSLLHPVEEPENENLQLRLRDCMEQLKEEQRVCIQLFYYEHRCYKEIAVALKLDENKVKSYIQNGKRNLKICIESNAVMKDAQA